MEAFRKKYPLGTAVECKVVRLANFGAFVELEGGLEGMIHVSELSEERVPHPEMLVKVGDTLKAEVSNIDSKDRKLSLSVKALKRREERTNLDAFKASQSGNNRTSLADTLNPELAAKLNSMTEKK